MKAIEDALEKGDYIALLNALMVRHQCGQSLAAMLIRVVMNNAGALDDCNLPPALEARLQEQIETVRDAILERRYAVE